MPRNYWMVVISAENFRITREQQFAVQGFKVRLKRRAERMEVGDRMLYYLSGAKLFPATATITSTYFEDRSPLWVSESDSDDYPYRVQIEPVMVLEEGEFLDAMQIAPRMEYIKKWTPERWPLAFIGDLHLIPRKDFSFLEEEMKKIVSARNRWHEGTGDPAHPMAQEQASDP